MSSRLLFFWIFVWDPLWVLGPGQWLLAQTFTPGGSLIWALLFGYGLFVSGFWVLVNDSKSLSEPNKPNPAEPEER